MSELARPGWVAQVLSEQRRRWQEGDRTQAETYLKTCPQAPPDANAALDIIYQEFVLREQAGEKPTLEEYLARFPAFEQQLRRQFALHEILDEESIVNKVPPTRRSDTVDWPGNRGAKQPAAPLPQQVGGYEIDSELGHGGMGVVYKARDPWLQRTVAIKMILAGDHGRPDLRRRFTIEAQATAQLQHANIVQVFEVGDHEGKPFLVLEYVDGPSLAARLATGPLEHREAARIVAALARAVQAAHEHGIVHRDLKPANILLSGGKSKAVPAPAPIPKITDFGLARLTQPGEGVSLDGRIMGTPGYMSPEQARGHAGEVGPPTDVYALGVILYECLTGRRPFCGTTLEAILLLVATRDPVPPRQLQPGIPRDLDTICLKCLHKEAPRRYSSAAAMADDLERFLAGRPVLARPIGRGERLLKWARREPGEAVLSAVLVLAAFLLMFALAAAWRAETGRAAAEQQKRHEMEYQLYLMRVGKAYHDLIATKKPPAWAGELLDQCPKVLRDWEWHYLDRLRREGPTKPLEGHAGKISSVAVSPDGGLIASSSGDGTVRLWSPDGKAVGTLAGSGPSINWVAFEPDGDNPLVAAGGENGQVVLWDPEHQEKLATFAGHRGPVSCVAFRPSSREVASAAWGGEGAEDVLIWDRKDQNLKRTLRGHTSRVVGLAYSVDGSMLATASHDMTVRLWQAETGAEIRVFAEHRCPVSAVAFSPDGTLVASVGGRSEGVNNPDEIELFIWETATGKLRHRLLGDLRRSFAVAFHPEGKRLATAGWDGDIKLWDVATGRELLALQGHTDAVSGIAFEAEGKFLASGSFDKTVRLWRAD